jgi:hypothetical protein
MRNNRAHRGPRSVLRRAGMVAGVAIAVPAGIGTGVTAHAASDVSRTVPVSTAAMPATGTMPGHDAPAPGSGCNGSLLTATLMPLSEHLDHAHFERSPQQQASDIESYDQYTKTHTVLVETMTQPARDDLFLVSDGSLTPLVQHLDHAHFERSPQQQAGDIESYDQYTKTHTVLVETILQPTLTAVSGDC